ncbi:SdpI family protein [Adhaeribacter terreus]|uniref:SdpI family protein n=1 Tax=Adhaeribacter terreus TaxID=529703 RepID=A0ABW0EF39_9BACT
MPATDLYILLIAVGGSYLLLIFISLFFYLKPPRRINSLYGYRTARSMKNLENWHFANKISARYMLLGSMAGLIIFLLSVAFLRDQLSVSVLTTGNLVIMCVSLIALIPAVEIKLKKFESERS